MASSSGGPRGTPISYEWVCRRCDAANAAGTAACQACGFQAHYTVAELAEVQGHMAPVGGAVLHLCSVVIASAAAVLLYTLFGDFPIVQLMGLKLLVLALGFAGALVYLAFRAVSRFILGLVAPARAPD